MTTDKPLSGIRRITIYANQYEPAKLDIINEASRTEVLTVRRGDGTLVYEWRYAG